MEGWQGRRRLRTEIYNTIPVKRALPSHNEFEAATDLEADTVAATEQQEQQHIVGAAVDENRADLEDSMHHNSTHTQTRTYRRAQTCLASYWLREQ